jgi:hypothetical protein
LQSGLLFRLPIFSKLYVVRHAEPAIRQKAVASAVGIIPLTIAGIALLRCGCAFAAFAIELGVGLLYFVWVLV